MSKSEYKRLCVQDPVGMANRLHETEKQLLERAAEITRLTAELFGVHDTLFKARVVSLERKLLERDAVIEQMREFVEAAINIGNEFGCIDLNYAEDYLALTPSEALAKHDAEVSAKALDDVAKGLVGRVGDLVRARAEELRRKV